MSRPLRLLTWNIHGAVGADRRCDTGRILAILAEIDADVVVLQEVDGRTHLGREPRAFETFAEALGGTVVEARMIGKPGREHGNLLWSRLPVTASAVHRLPGGIEPRGLIEAHVDGPFGPVRVFGTHFSLSVPARRGQARTCAEHMAKSPLPAVICGDFNEWHPAGPVHRTLSEIAPTAHRPKTWPARRPFVAMDRVYAGAGLRLRVLETPVEARQASDHLPVLVELSVPGPASDALSKTSDI